MKIKKVCEKIILIIVTISLLITFLVAPSSYAKLSLSDGEFYYAGTTKGSYTAAGDGIFSWLLENLSKIADWLVGIMTMGPRMVFVGWAALIERLLTWTLETTTGVNINGDGVNSNTDLSSISDSSSNITVEAIVYNRVPAFDIDFFDLEYDPTVSGTGQIYKCQKCNEESSVCVTGTSCNCACNGRCDGCVKYMAALEMQEQAEENPPVVIQIKRLVSQWYYILRLLSIMAMLIVLLGIGVKMAFTTIASEKALYKRMLFDWIAGIIILFTAHYIMIAIIFINGLMVDIIKESANSINQVQLKQLYDKNDEKGEMNEISDADIEISVYEEIRTRAYDPKLSVGLSGMIMYITLIYFAVRYSLVYLKRYLTLIVLTLMGPPVGAAYALQKAISGKSSTFKAWLTEYIMNVIIQTVHALIYAVFISSALVFSLQSVAGMIVALIFMNFALKAEKLFKQIFKMSSTGSLLEAAEQAGDAEQIKSNLGAVKGLYMGAKPVTNALMHSPFAQAVKGAGKLGLAFAALDDTNNTNNGEHDSVEKDDSGDVSGSENSSGAIPPPQNGGAGVPEVQSDPSVDAEVDSSSGDVTYGAAKEFIDSTKGLMTKGEARLRGEVEEKLAAYADAPEDKKEQAAQELNIAMDNYTKHRKLGIPTTGQIIAGHLERLVDVQNNFTYNPVRNAEGKSTFIQKGVAFGKMAFGTEHYDPSKGKWVSDGNAYYQQFGASNLLGFTDEDKKVFKEQVLNPIAKGFGGIMSTMVGLGTLVAHPSMGMGLLAGGIKLSNSAFGVKAVNKGYKGTYTFSRFSVPSMKTIQKEVQARANREINAMTSNADEHMVQRIKNDHPELFDKLREDIHKDMKTDTFTDNLVEDLKVSRNTLATTAGAAFITGAIVNPGVVAPIAVISGAAFGARRFVAKTGISANIEAIQKHSAKQAREQQLGFMKDSLYQQAAVESAVTEHMDKVKEEEEKKRLYEEQGYDYDPVTGELKEKGDEAKKAKEKYDQEMIEIYLAQGLKYDPKTQTLTPLTEDEEKSKKEPEVELIDNRHQRNGNKTYTDADKALLNKSIDDAIQSIVDKTGGKVDLTDQKVQDAVIEEIAVKLERSNMITRETKVESIVKGGREGLVSTLKKKAEVKNAEYALNAQEPEFSEDEISEIREVAANLANEKGNDYTEVSASQVLDIVNKNIKSNKKKTAGKKAPAKPEKVKTIKDIEEQKTNASIREAAVTSYLDHIQKLQPSVTQSSAMQNRKKAKNVVDAKLKSRRRKLEQILTLDIEIPEEYGNGTDAAIAMASEAKAGERKTFKTKDGKTVELGSQEAADVLDLLFQRKEMEAINEFAESELEIKSGTKSYKDSLKKKTEASIEYYRAQMAVENIKLSDTRLEKYDEEIAKVKDPADKEILEKKHKMLTSSINKLKELEQKKVDAERKLESSGPIVDVNDFISETFGKKARKA